jgi:hypothetical protein
LHFYNNRKVRFWAATLQAAPTSQRSETCQYHFHLQGSLQIVKPGRVIAVPVIGSSHDIRKNYW